jgi:hypothetical protein
LPAPELPPDDWVRSEEERNDSIQNSGPMTQMSGTDVLILGRYRWGKLGNR